MGAGRKKETYTLQEKNQNFGTTLSYRNVRKSELGGVIFGCKNNTFQECFEKQLFGLPSPHFSYIRNIEPGLPLFLFNYSDRKLHGLFEAASVGKMNIDPQGWTSDGSESTPYAAQVRFRIRQQCQPLLEDQFSKIIEDNYYETRLFWFELDQNQTKKLISLFSSKPATCSSHSKGTEKCSTIFKSLSNDTQGKNNTGWEDGKGIGIVKGVHNLESHLLPNSRDKIQPFDASVNGGAAKTHTGLANSAQTGFCSYSSVLRGQMLESQNHTDTRHKMQSIDAPVSGESAKNHSGALDSTQTGFCSYSSVLTGKLESQALSDSRHKMHSFNTSFDVEAAHNHIGAANSGSGFASYSSVLIGSSHPDKGKKTSHLLVNSASSAEEIKVEETKIPEMEMKFPCSAQHKGHMESLKEKSSEETHDLNYCKKELREHDVKLDDIDQHMEALCLSVATEAMSCLPLSPCGFVPTTDAGWEDREFVSRTRDGTAFYSKKTELQETSPYIASFPNSGWHSDRACFDEHPSVGTDKGVHLISNDEYSLLSEVMRVTRSSNTMDKGTGMQMMASDRLCSTEADRKFDMKSLDIVSFASMILQEVNELKSYQSKQARKIISLEQELDESKQEIRNLKDRWKMLECNPQTETKHLRKDTKPNLEDAVLIVGGFDGLTFLSSLECYFPLQDSLDPLCSMASVRSYALTVKQNSDVYVIGGVHDNVWFDTVESYNLSKNQWVACPPLNQKKGSLAGVSFNDKIFIMGGGNGLCCFSEVELFDINVGRWIPSRSMLHKRFATAAAVINGMIYVVGGYDGHHYLNSVEAFDPREYSWRKVQNMSTRRGCHSLVTLGGKLHAIGGFNGDQMVPSVEIFDPRMNTWIMGEAMNYSRGYSGAIAIRDSIFVMGGLNQHNTVLDVVECYKDGQGWQLTDMKAIGKRCFFSAISF